MRVVILTPRLQSPQVGRLCRSLADVGAPAAAVICARHPLQGRLDHWLANNTFVRRLAARFNRDSAIQPYEPILRMLREKGTGYCLFTGLFHSPRVVAHLRRLQPDLLINCLGPLYRKATIEQARVGLINCHTALLPEFRGMHVAEWSVLHGYPTGNTVHFVDLGVDTGPMLRFFAVSVEDCQTVEQMRSTLASVQWEHVARTVRLLIDGKITPVEQKPEGGRQYFRMHPTIRVQVARILSQGYKPSVDISGRPYVHSANGAAA